MLPTLILAIPFMLQVAAPPNDARTAPPPIKMGLWESTLGGPAGGGMKVRVCTTPETYQNAFARIPPGCTMSNVARDRSHVSADVACTLHDASSSGHIDVEFPDAENTHMVMNLNMTVQGRSTVVTIKADSHYVSSDCGGIQPSKPQIVK